jgi:hypothetical protein
MTAPKAKPPVDPPGGGATDAGRRKADRRAADGKLAEGATEQRKADRRGAPVVPDPTETEGDPTESLDFSPREITRAAFDSVSNALKAIPETVAAAVKGTPAPEKVTEAVPKQASRLMRFFGWQDPE